MVLRQSSLLIVGRHLPMESLSEFHQPPTIVGARPGSVADPSMSTFMTGSPTGAQFPAACRLRTLTTALKEHLPYKLTGAQSTAIREIVADMCSERKMHRLLQGDVGSGKTIVGLFAALLAMENGYQAALMAPTELLAEQHNRTISGLLEPLSIRPLLVTGGMPAPERAKAARAMAANAPVLVIGTHALVQESATFAKLGFVAIDEQHRFGVEHRAALAAKGEAPDVLLMSATPIPRSLALTLYGDLDVSTLDERPAGRQRTFSLARAPAKMSLRIS